MWNARLDKAQAGIKIARRNINNLIYADAAADAKSIQSCPTLCDPIDGSPPGSAVPGILQARTLEWVAISFSDAWKWKVKVKSLSHVWLFATPWTVAYQAPLSMGFPRQEYWSGLPLPSPGHAWDFVKTKWLSHKVEIWIAIKNLKPAADFSVFWISFYFFFLRLLVETKLSLS